MSRFAGRRPTETYAAPNLADKTFEGIIESVSDPTGSFALWVNVPNLGKGLLIKSRLLNPKSSADDFQPGQKISVKQVPERDGRLALEQVESDVDLAGENA